MFLLIILSAFVAIAFGGPKFSTSLSNDGIVGGHDTTIEEHPWQCSMQIFGLHWCGCSLIAWNRCLTAAHCTYGEVASTISVRCGTTTQKAGGRVVDVVRYYQHPKFNFKSADNDMSLLYLASPLSPSPQTQLISLAPANKVYQNGYQLNSTGWGKNSGNGPYPKILQVVTLNVVENKECQKKFSKLNSTHKISDRMICAGSQNKDKGDCNGDSGGPLDDGTTLVGVVSWGKSRCDTNYPSVFASVPAMRDWIDSVLAI